MDGQAMVRDSSYLEHYLGSYASLLTDPMTVEIAMNPDRSIWVLKRGDVHGVECRRVLNHTLRVFWGPV